MLHRHKTAWSVTAALIATSAGGCYSPFVQYPDLAHPGTAVRQRAAAVEHDPFPLNDIGPEIVGGRPLGFQAGVLEAERQTMNATPPPGVAPTIVPGAPVRPLVGPAFTPAPVLPAVPAGPPVTGPPPVITTPYPPAQAPSFIQQQRSPY